MTKRILLVRNTQEAINPNSYNVQEIGIGKAFCRLGYDYDYVCFNPKEQKEWIFYETNGCRACFIEKKRFRFFRWGINLNLLKKQFLNQYDIIISREYYQLMTLLYALRKDNVSMYSGPYYNLFFNKWFSPIYDILFTRLLNRRLKGKFVKSLLAKDFLEKKGYSDVVNVGVGLDTERFDSYVEINDKTKSLIEFMKNNRCLLYVGALSDRKNYPFMLEVYQKVLEKEPDVKFVIIGKSKIGPFSKMIGMKDEDYARKYMRKFPQIVWDGIYHVESLDNPQLKFIYPLAKAFLLPSKLEIFGMVLLEAMYLGAPVITSRNGGSVTLIGEDGPGLIVDEFDSYKWSEAIMAYLHNPKMVSEIIKKAHQVVLEEYNWDVIAKKMISKIETYHNS